MLVEDDALMALILRFVVNTDDDVLSSEEFLQRPGKRIAEDGSHESAQAYQ